MNLKQLPTLMALTALAFTAAPRAAAIPLNYAISGGIVNAHSSGPGLLINTSVAPSLAGTAFTLDDGDSSGWFSFFKIWTNESSVNSDDLVVKPISATLTFSDPVTSAIVDGATFGGKILWGAAQGGRVVWDGPTTVVLADRTFMISLSDGFFNWGPFGIKEGIHHGGKVKAEIVQQSSTKPEPETPVAVPDTASTFVLLGAALIAIGLARRKTVAAFET